MTMIGRGRFMWLTPINAFTTRSESTLNESNDREPERMMGGERTRAYRYGMTLLCVGALFNWFALTDNYSDPVKFIGYTCLASGALLVCMAICFWANSAHRQVHNQVRPEQNGDVIVNTMVRPNRERRANREKPPDYDTVADLSPPPSYDDAIRLSPAYLPPPGSTPEAPSLDTATGQQPYNNSTESHSVIVSISPPSPDDKPPEVMNESNVVRPDSSPLTRVIRLSSRLLRRTLSNIDNTDEESASQHSRQMEPQQQQQQQMPKIHRSNSAQDVKHI